VAGWEIPKNKIPKAKETANDKIPARAGGTPAIQQVWKPAPRVAGWAGCGLGVLVFECMGWFCFWDLGTPEFFSRGGAAVALTKLNLSDENNKVPFPAKKRDFP